MFVNYEATATDRRQFLTRTAATGAGALAGASALEALVPSFAAAKKGGVTKRDRDILIAAEIAEALAVTTYTNIVHRAPFFKRLASDDQGYMKAARQEEMSHYLLEKSATGKPSPFTTFYYPHRMFADAQTTPNVLVLARVVGPGVAKRDGGPVEKITGIQGVAESVDPPNNNGYERTLGWTKISQAVAALTPFVDKTAAAKAGFDTSKPHKFKPFAPKLPE